MDVSLQVELPFRLFLDPRKNLKMLKILKTYGYLKVGTKLIPVVALLNILATPVVLEFA